MIILQLESDQKTVLKSQFQIEKFHFLSIILYHIFNVNSIEGHFGPFVAHFGVRLRSENFLGSLYTVYQLLFSEHASN